VCSLLCLIGRQWLTLTDKDGRRRLDDPNDMVRLEIEAALERDVRVIPLLVDGASMPQVPDLPDSLAKLARRQALPIRSDSFRADVTRLVGTIERVLDASTPTSVPDSTAAPRVGRGVGPSDTTPALIPVHVFRHAKEVSGVAFSPDGRLLATGSDDHTAQLWEVASGREVSRVTHDDWVWWLAFSPDGQTLATASQDGTARLWEVASRQERARFTHGGTVWTIAFSPDGRLVATASYDQTARLWEVASEQEHARFAYDDEVLGVAFSPDGRLLAVGSADQTARIWEIASMQERTRFTHDDLVVWVAFSPDGRLLATASTTARVWDVASGQERAWVPHDDMVAGVAFSPDGRLLATASYDKTARVWRLPEPR
jgi:WD40 repeat protein